MTDKFAMTDKNIDELKELNTLLQSDKIAGESTGTPLEQQVALSRAFNLAANLSYTHPQDAYDMWTRYMPESEPVPSVLTAAYDRLSPEQKANHVSALDVAELAEARRDNQHRILARVLDRLDVKYPGASARQDIDGEMSSAGFYKEIVNLFEEKDFPEMEKPEAFPQLEDLLKLTNFLDRHNDSEQRAELEQSAAEYAAIAATEMNFEQLDFGNALEVEDTDRLVFDTFEELEEFSKELAKDSRTIPLPDYAAVVYVDKMTDRLTLAAKTPRDLYDIEALTRGGAGKETGLQESAGNKLVFNNKDSLGSVPALSIALVRLKLSEKEIHEVQTAVREITTPKPMDISEQAVKRAYELRMLRKRDQERAQRDQERAERDAERATTQAAPVGAEAPQQSITRDEAFTFPQDGKVVPAQVARSYVKVAGRGCDKFYLNSRLDTLAFVDKGNKLETKSDSEHTAEALVLIADARGWDRLKVSGTEAFRREVWLEASARGIVVRGYTPNDVDKALLAKKAEKVEKMERNSIERVSPQEREAPAPAASVSSTATKKASAKTENRETGNTKVFSGEMIEHGAAPFEFNKDNKPNYYVKYKGNDGQERITWGLDLERAVTESGAKKGDRITLQNAGREAVEIMADVKDELGKVVGQKLIKTHRNSWNVEVAKDFLNMPTREFVEKHPDHLNAAALKEFAKKVVAEAPQFSHLSSTDKARFQSGVESKLVKSIENNHTVSPLKLISNTKEEEVIQERRPERGRNR